VCEIFGAELTDALSRIIARGAKAAVAAMPTSF
jgi:hypothetical protein